MFARMFTAVGISIAISISVYAVQNEPRIQRNTGGPDYASVLNNIAMRGKSPQDNAAALYLDAFELYKPEPPQLFRLRIWQGWPTEMTARQRAHIDEWLIANEAALTKLHAGSRMGFFWLTYPANIPLGTGPLSKYTQVNNLANAVCWQAKVKAADDLVDDAFADVLTAFRFGRQIAAAPHTLAEQTTGFTIQTTAMWTAVQIIAHANPDAAALAELPMALQLDCAGHNFYFDLTAARLWVNDAIERTFTAEGTVSTLQLDAMQRSLNLSPEELARWQGLNQTQTTSQAREIFVFLEPAVKQTPWELKKDGVNLAAKIDSLTNGNVLLEHYRPDLGSNIDLPFRCRAQTEAVIAICAVKRYAADNKAIPPTLKVLEVSGYLKQIPQDPYRDGQLSYVALPNNFRLYSWGADFTDNFARPSKWGQGPEGGDEVFWPIP